MRSNPRKAREDLMMAGKKVRMVHRKTKKARVKSTRVASGKVGRQSGIAGKGRKTKKAGGQDPTRAGRSNIRRNKCAGAGRQNATDKKRRNELSDAVGNADGCAARVVVGERYDGKWDESSNASVTRIACRTGVVARKRAGACGKGRVTQHTIEVLAAVGHAVRVRLLVKLLEGPATYRALQRVTKQKPGPLYHHINQLRLSGLILPKQRDLYELTRGGRNLILAVLTIGPLVRDGRRRPVSTGNKQ